MSELAAELSHDLRVPLSTAVGWAPPPLETGAEIRIEIPEDEAVR